MEVKKNLRQLVMNLAIVEAHKQGDVIRVVRGSTVKEVSLEQL